MMKIKFTTNFCIKLVSCQITTISMQNNIVLLCIFPETFPFDEHEFITQFGDHTTSTF